MEPTEFEKWCADRLKFPVSYITDNRFGDGYRHDYIDALHSAYMAGVTSMLPYKTLAKGATNEG